MACPNHPSNFFPRNMQRVPGTYILPNPGNIANLHKKTRDIMPIWVEGVQLNYRKHLAPNKILLCNWVLSHTSPTGFRIGGIYNSRYHCNIMETPMIEADINPSTLSANFSFLYHPIDSIRIECLTQTGPYPWSDCRTGDNVVSVEFIGKSSTSTLNVYNACRESGRFTVGYLQSITSRLALGSELLYEWFKGKRNAQLALCGRYSRETYAVAATVSSEALDISYWRQIHRAIQMGTSIVYNQRTKKAIGSIFYQWEFRDAYIRGMVDSDWSVGFTYNRRIFDLCCSVGYSVLLCIPTSRFACGIKFDIEPNYYYKTVS